MGLIDKNDDGHISIGEASFAYLQREEFEKACRESEAGGDSAGGFARDAAGDEPVGGCMGCMAGCGGCLLMLLVFALGVAALFFLFAFI